MRRLVIAWAPAAAAPPKRLYVSLGTTYPDVILGLWVNGDQASRDLATLSVTAFRSLINPTLKAAYASAGARFVDVTAASVARVCELSYFCALGDIHTRTDGYALISRLVARELPRRG